MWKERRNTERKERQKGGEIAKSEVERIKDGE